MYKPPDKRIVSLNETVEEDCKVDGDRVCIFRVDTGVLPHVDDGLVKGGGEARQACELSLEKQISVQCQPVGLDAKAKCRFWKLRLRHPFGQGSHSFSFVLFLRCVEPHC